MVFYEAFFLHDKVVGTIKILSFRELFIYVYFIFHTLGLFLFFILEETLFIYIFINNNGDTYII